MSNDKEIVTRTNDGYVVELFAKSNVKTKIKSEMEGISILEPDKSFVEDELYSIYAELVSEMDYKPVIIKTPKLDKEINVLKTQIRAMLRAATHGDLSILFSQISTIDELREYNKILEMCQDELEEGNIPYKKHMKIGLLVEMPSVALMSYEFARECDFFFIDTDSLTNYAFGNKKNINLSLDSQLAVIRLLKQTIEGAHDAGIFCGICGDIVENELYMPLLIGIGLDQFSIEEKNIDKIRTQIQELDKSECKELTDEILHQRTIEDIEKKLKQFAEN